MIVAIRTARPTVNLARARHYYEVLVGLPLLGDFVGHDGFDGVIVGLPDEQAQLELVNDPHNTVPRPSSEDALVLYCHAATAREIAERLRASDVPEVPGDAADLNPYWPRRGASVFLDPDGYRLIIAVSGE